jgi:hypothetical protein
LAEVKASKSNAEAQSLRAVAGKQFEGIVSKAVNDILNREDIYAVSLKGLNQLIKHDPEFKEVLEFAKAPVPHPCQQGYEMMLPDTDVVVYYGQKDHTISCKVSFHARQTESTFWAKVLKNHGSKFYLATEDKSKELGTCDEGRKARRLLEAYMDSTYLMSQYAKNMKGFEEDIGKFYEVFEDSKRSGYESQNTRIFDSKRPTDAYCKKVRPFDDLFFDLMRVKFDSRR